MFLFGSPLNHLGWLEPQAEESFRTAAKNSSMPLMIGVAFISYARRRSGGGGAGAWSYGGGAWSVPKAIRRPETVRAARACPRPRDRKTRTPGGDHQASKRGVVSEGEHGRGDTSRRKVLRYQHTARNVLNRGGQSPPVLPPTIAHTSLLHCGISTLPLSALGRSGDHPSPRWAKSL